MTGTPRMIAAHVAVVGDAIQRLEVSPAFRLRADWQDRVRLLRDIEAFVQQSVSSGDCVSRCDGIPFEHDGAFKCYKCGAQWGQITNPDPKTHATAGDCVSIPRSKVERHIKRLEAIIEFGYSLTAIEVDMLADLQGWLGEKP